MDDEQRTNDARDVDRRVLDELAPGLSDPLAERVLALAPTAQRPLTGARLAEIRRALRADRDELRAARPFVDRCLTGDADVDQVDEVVRSWGAASRAGGAGASLQRLLGLTDDEYDAWERDPADRRTTVAAVVAARRAHAHPQHGQPGEGRAPQRRFPALIEGVERELPVERVRLEADVVGSIEDETLDDETLDTKRR